jgi:hypothetical protein
MPWKCNVSKRCRHKHRWHDAFIEDVDVKKDETQSDTPPNFLMDSTMSPKVKTMEGEGVGVRSLVHNTLGVEGHARALGWGLGRLTSKSITNMDLHQLNNKLFSAQLEHFMCMDEPWANTDSQDSPWPGFEEATTFPLIVFFVPGHEANTQMLFCPGTPKWEF